MDLKQIQNAHMHKYVLILVGISALFLFTFPTAYLRVARSDQFSNIPLKSLTLEGQWDEPER